MIKMNVLELCIHIVHDLICYLYLSRAKNWPSERSYCFLRPCKGAWHCSGFRDRKMNKTVLVLKKFSSPSGEKNTNYNSMFVRAVVDPSNTKKDVITWAGRGNEWVHPIRKMMGKLSLKGWIPSVNEGGIKVIRF